MASRATRMRLNVKLTRRCDSQKVGAIGRFNLQLRVYPDGKKWVQP